jgi:hypothetical protein
VFLTFPQDHRMWIALLLPLHAGLAFGIARSSERS